MALDDTGAPATGARRGRHARRASPPGTTATRRSPCTRSSATPYGYEIDVAYYTGCRLCAAECPAGATRRGPRRSDGLGCAAARRGKIANRVARARSHRRIALLALGGVLVLAGVAIAGPTGDFVSSSGPTGGLLAAGPVNPANGFPDWYRDNKGLELQGCMNPRDPNCGAIAVPDGTQPVAFRATSRTSSSTCWPMPRA